MEKLNLTPFRNFALLFLSVIPACVVSGSVTHGAVDSFLNHTYSYDFTGAPSVEPSFSPSSFPTLSPSLYPTSMPTVSPTIVPTVSPSEVPSTQPSEYPTAKPSNRPSYPPSSIPTSSPSVQPTTTPSSQPSVPPTSIPVFTIDFQLRLYERDEEMDEEEVSVFESTVASFATKCLPAEIDISSTQVKSQKLDDNDLKLELNIKGRCPHVIAETIKETIVNCFNTNYNELVFQHEKDSGSDNGGNKLVVVIVVAATIGCSALVVGALLIVRRRRISEKTVFNFSPHRMQNFDDIQINCEIGDALEDFTRVTELKQACREDDELMDVPNAIIAHMDADECTRISDLKSHCHGVEDGGHLSVRNEEKGSELKLDVFQDNEIMEVLAQDKVHNKKRNIFQWKSRERKDREKDVHASRLENIEEGNSSENDTDLSYDHDKVAMNISATMVSSSSAPGGVHLSKTALNEVAKLPPMMREVSLIDNDSTIASSKAGSKSVNTTDIERTSKMSCFSIMHKPCGNGHKTKSTAEKIDEVLKEHDLEDATIDNYYEDVEKNANEEKAQHASEDHRHPGEEHCPVIDQQENTKRLNEEENYLHEHSVVPLRQDRRMLVPVGSGQGWEISQGGAASKTGHEGELIPFDRKTDVLPVSFDLSQSLERIKESAELARNKNLRFVGKGDGLRTGGPRRNTLISPRGDKAQQSLTTPSPLTYAGSMITTRVSNSRSRSKSPPPPRKSHSRSRSRSNSSDLEDVYNPDEIEWGALKEQNRFLS